MNLRNFSKGTGFTTIYNKFAEPSTFNHQPSTFYLTPSPINLQPPIPPQKIRNIHFLFAFELQFF